MSLDYFLLCKEGYDNMMHHLDSIIHIYKDIHEITNDFLENHCEENQSKENQSKEIVDVMLDPQKQINIQCFIDKRNYIKQMKIYTEDKDRQSRTTSIFNRRRYPLIDKSEL